MGVDTLHVVVANHTRVLSQSQDPKIIELVRSWILSYYNKSLNVVGITYLERLTYLDLDRLWTLISLLDSLRSSCCIHLETSISSFYKTNHNWMTSAVS